jgi:SAM-dependent methyltransferase
MTNKDFVWLHLRDLPYFRAMLRAVESTYYQDQALPRPVLDLGCGDGHFASLTFEQPLDVGLDPWSGPIRQARQLNVYRSLVQADGAQMPFPDGHFASGLSNSVLEHIPHIDAVLAETGRVLKPGAPFLFCVPNPRYLSELSLPTIFGRLGLKKVGQAYTQWFKRMSRVQHADWPETWQKRLEQAGFGLEKWWHYFSPQAMRALEWGHYFGAPTLLPHALSKHWIVAPYRWNLAITERYVRQFTDSTADSKGTFTFYIAHKL